MKINSHISTRNNQVYKTHLKKQMEKFSIPTFDATPNSVVDSNKKVIYNASACMVGVAKGHGLYCSEAFIEKLVSLGVKNGRVPVHMGHFNECDTDDQLVKRVGYAENFRKEGKKALCDIVFVESEHNKGYIDHVFAYAENDPKSFGLSIVFDTMPLPEGEEPEKYQTADGTVLEEATIDKFRGVDFVGSPAANADGLFAFSEKQMHLAEVATRWFQKQSKSKQKGIIGFFKRLSKTGDIAINQEDVMKAFCVKQEDILLTTETVKQMKFSEMTTADGMVFIFEGDKPAIMEPAVMRDAEGNEGPAPDGEYQVTADDGTMYEIVVVAGIVTEIALPQAEVIEEEVGMSEEEKAAEEEALRIENEAKEQFTKKAKEALKSNVSKMPVTNQINTKPAKMKQVLSVEEQKNFYNIYKLRRSEVKMITKAQALAKGIDAVSFAEGVDFSDVPARCKEFFDQNWQELFYDSMLTVWLTPMTTDPNFNTNSPYNMLMPVYKLVDAEENEGITRSDAGDCNLPASTVTFKPEYPEISVCWNRIATKFCPREWRNIENGKLYLGTMQLPLEAVIIGMIMDQIKQEYNSILIKGNTSNPSPKYLATCDGLLKKISDAVTATSIPAAQIFEYGTDINTFTVSNVIEQLQMLAKAMPVEVKTAARKGNVTVVMLVSENIYEMYAQALANANLANAQLGSYIDGQFFPSFLYGATFKVNVVPNQDMLGAVQDEDHIFVYCKEHVGYIKQEELPSPYTAMDNISREIIFDWTYAMGVQPAFWEYVVVTQPAIIP